VLLQLKLATSTQAKCIGNRPSPVCVMSLNVSVSIEPFDSERLSAFRKKNIQGRQICTL